MCAPGASWPVPSAEPPHAWGPCGWCSSRVPAAGYHSLASHEQRLQRPRKAYRAELLRFHAPEYVQFLADCTPDNKEDMKDEQWQVPGDQGRVQALCSAAPGRRSVG